MKVPVLVLAFNRADHVSEAMKAIRAKNIFPMIRCNKLGMIDSVLAEITRLYQESQLN